MTPATGSPASVYDGERLAEGARQHRNGRTAAREIRQHLHGDIGGKGGDALRRHAMISGKDDDRRAVGARPLGVLQGREADSEILQTAERPCWLGELGLPVLGKRLMGG
jgi:hypothetical protein